MSRIRNAVGPFVAGLVVLGNLALAGPVSQAAAQGNVSWMVTFGPEVVGLVTQKFVPSGDSYDSAMIAVNGTVYTVPRDFYNVVQVSDVVRFDGVEWTKLSKI